MSDFFPASNWALAITVQDKAGNCDANAPI